MRPSKDNAQAGYQPAGASEQTELHDANDGVLGTSDEAHEHHIRQLGDAMVAAANAGDRSEAKRYQDLMYRAIAARSPREVQRRQTEIEKAIERSTTTLAHAIPARRLVE